ncbi:hypothetical protein EDB84DRAFT_1469089 [Lactarius hengduanensis]|nr:hypothetical protein EDB84DRAFT_1469089 [Lactarius hengduanensis]
MISVALENPLIRFNIPNSPLLLSLPLDAGSHPTHLSTSSVPPCTMSPSKKPHFPQVPDVVITRPLSNDRSPPPPSHRTPPRPKPRLSAAASKKLVEFIDFLEKIDRDMTADIQHVKESIKEAHEYVGEWQDERRARRAELLRRKERERRETKEPDSDFWLGI